MNKRVVALTLLFTLLNMTLFFLFLNVRQPEANLQRLSSKLKRMEDKYFLIGNKNVLPNGLEYILLISRIKNYPMNAWL